MHLLFRCCRITVLYVCMYDMSVILTDQTLQQPQLVSDSIIDVMLSTYFNMYTLLA